jgi:hypothetical protein
MADLTPSEIIVPPTDEEIGEALLKYMRAIPGFPINDWNSGGRVRTLYETEKLTLGNLLQGAIPAVLGAGVPDFAGEAWIGLVADQLYKLARAGALLATQTMVLTCDGSHGPYTITPNQLWFTGPTGNRWTNTTGGTLSTSGTLSITIAAEGPGGQYNDPAGTIHTYEVALAGVTASNTAADFTPVAIGASSSGTITPSRTSVGVAPSQASFLIRIDSSGQVGAGAWSYSVDGGKTFRSAGTIATTDLLLAGGGASGTRVTFANGAGTPSFVSGDLFSFSTPGSSFITKGKDQEALETLIARCHARWPDLAVKPKESRYAKWAKQASASVVRVRLEEDASYPGRLYLTLAGLTGTVSAGIATTVQAYVEQRQPIGRIIVAQPAVTQEVAATGTVYVSAANKTKIQAAAQAAWQVKLFGTDVGGVVRVSDLVRSVMDAGAIDFVSPQLNGSGTIVPLPATKVAILPAAAPLLANQLTWAVQ